MTTIKNILDQGFSLKENKNIKAIKSPYYNYIFNKKSGFFARWGKTKEDDPEFSFFGPEILDCEVTTSCRGINGKLCKFCYKGNTPNGKNMSFNTFKNVLSRFPRVKGNHVLTQIAFGADSECKSNPDIWKMMEHCRKVGVIPNITVSNVSRKTADRLAYYCGAVAVSRYDDKNVCYDSVDRIKMAALNMKILVRRKKVIK